MPSSPQSQQLVSSPEILWKDDFGKRGPCCLLSLVPSLPSQPTSRCYSRKQDSWYPGTGQVLGMHGVIISSRVPVLTDKMKMWSTVVTQRQFLSSSPPRSHLSPATFPLSLFSFPSVTPSPCFSTALTTSAMWLVCHVSTP